MRPQIREAGSTLFVVVDESILQQGSDEVLDSMRVNKAVSEVALPKADRSSLNLSLLTLKST